MVAWPNVTSWQTRRAQSTTPFTPLALTALRGWYESDSGTTVVVGVSQWNDKSGLGNHLLQATGGAQPLLVPAQINGLPAIVFDGVDDFMRAVIVGLVQPSTVFAVFSQATWVSPNTIVDGNVSTMMRVFQTGSSPRIGISAGTTLAGAVGPTLGTFGLATAIFNGASSSIQINSIAATSGPAGAGNAGGVVVGARGDGTINASCSVAMLIVTAASATAGEIANVKAYVTTKYGFAA